MSDYRLSADLTLAYLTRIGLVFVFVAKIYGDGMFRIPGVEKGDGLLGTLLSAIRGVVVYGSAYGVYPLVVLYLVAARRRVAGFRWAGLAPVIILVVFMALMCAISPATDAVGYRVGRFFVDALPAMLAVLHCVDRAGIRMIRAALVGAAGAAIVILMLSGRFIPLLRGDMPSVNWAAAELGPEYAERFVLQSDPITTAMMLYLSALAGFSLSRDCRRFSRRILVLAISCTSAVMAMLTGARGPLLAFLAALMVFLLVSRMRLRRKLIVVSVSVGLLAGALSVLPAISPESAKRAYGALGRVVPALDIYGTSEAMTEVDGRNERFRAVLATPPSLLGRGVGAYGQETSNPTDYVHGIFLEAYYETGVLGALVIGGVFAYCFVRLVSLALRRSGLAQFALICLTFYVADAQLSGTLLYDIGTLGFLVLSCLAITVEHAALRRENLHSGFVSKHAAKTS